MAAAKLADLSTINAIVTVGFNAAGDGEGFYKVQSSAPAAPAISFPGILGRWIVLAGDRINLRAMGAPIDGTDQTDYLQDAVDTQKPIFIPASTSLGVMISAPITFLGHISIEGIGGAISGAAPYSQIYGNFAGPLIHRSDCLVTDDYPNPPNISNPSAGTGTRFGLRNITMRNAHEAGSCIQVYNCVCPIPIQSVNFAFRYRGAEMIQPFGATLIDCNFQSDWCAAHDVLTEDYKDAVGLIANQLRVFNCDIAGCGTAIRAWGSVSVYGGRIEVNGLAFHLGDRCIGEGGNNQPYAWSCGAIEGITLEANHTGIEALAMNDARIANISSYSSANGPAHRTAPYNGYGDFGLKVFTGNSGSIIEGITMVGSYMKYAYDIAATYYGQIRSVGGVNTVVPTTSVVRPIGIHKTNMMNTNQAQRHIFDVDTWDKSSALLVDDDRYASHIGNLLIPALVQPDQTKAPVYGRNLSGTLAVANGATTATYTFMTEQGGGNAAYSGDISAVAQPGSSLAPGTYYYAATLVGPRGESGTNGPFTIPPAVTPGAGSTYQSIVIAANQKASLPTYGQGAVGPRLRRRYYRGTVLGLFDGFWDDIATSTTFFDDGTRAFDGVGYPPGVGAVVPTQVETDANYFIQVSPTWATTWYVSAKSTIAFTITFGTAAPSDQTVGWLMYRP
jgi:hypothetical protein